MVVARLCKVPSLAHRPWHVVAGRIQSPPKPSVPVKCNGRNQSYDFPRKTGVWPPERNERIDWLESSDDGEGGGEALANVLSGELWIGAIVGILTGVTVIAFSTSVRLLQDLFQISEDSISVFGSSSSSERMAGLSDTLPFTPRVLVPIIGAILSTSVLSIATNISARKSNLTSENKQNSSGFRVATEARVAAAALNLGTGNSLGPEGPSVEIGSAWARVFSGASQSIFAAGLAAGVSAGFDAPVSGVLFALEKTSLSSSKTNGSGSSTLTPIVVAAVGAAVASRLGLGEAPALFAIPSYQLGSYYELPLYAILGLGCGAASLVYLRLSQALVKTKSNVLTRGLNPNILPPIAAFFTGLFAIRYPEVMYQGFANFDRILESTDIVDLGDYQGFYPLQQVSYSEWDLLQIAFVKILVTALSRSFGLEGGVYAPSLFIGATLGLAFGIYSQDIFEGFVVNPSYLSAPQVYALAGMAAMLAGICRIPLTSSLILFEITRDYGIIIPTLISVAVAYAQVSTVDVLSSSISKSNASNSDTENSTPGSGSRNQAGVLVEDTNWKEIVGALR
ncbi:hypothetical protein AAMO2058_001046300 [Amorphochlora amoebiformis]